MSTIDELLEKVAQNIGANRQNVSTPAAGISERKAMHSGNIRKEDGAGKEDMRISAPLIRMQADVAQAKGRRHLSDILRIASEIARIPERDMARLDAMAKDEIPAFADYIENEYQSILFSEYLRGQVR